jgi:signal transduction histidine kinase
MIEPTQRRLTLLFTGMLLVVIALAFGGISGFYYVSLRNYLELHLREEIAENVLPYVAKGDWAGLAKVVDTDFFQVLDAAGNVVMETSNPVGIDPPVNLRLLQGALAGLAGNEQLVLGGRSVMVAYVPITVDQVGRAVASLEVLAAFDRNIRWLGLFGFPVVLVLSYLLSRVLVARVMIPIRAVFTYQQLFSANVSHELLSPLTALKGGMEVALRRERGAQDYRDILSDGLQQVDRIVDLLRDLELLASARFRPADLLREPVDLAALVEQCLLARTAPASGSAPRWIRETRAGVICSADRALVRRVVENLLDNAAKYGLPGGEVRIALDAHAGAARLLVANGCAPLPPEARAALFEPFSRAPGAQRQRIAGRGLGLYLARHIARSHGGDLVLEPGPAEQFRITLTLPIKSHPPATSRRAGGGGT